MFAFASHVPLFLEIFILNFLQLFTIAFLQDENRNQKPRIL